MKFRHALLAFVAFWVAAEGWSFPWSAVWWPRTNWIVQYGVFSLLTVLYFREKLRFYAIDIALITIVSRIIAALAWRQWMMEGWFGYTWLAWLPEVTGSDGEGSYNMVEYEFFIVAFVLIATIRFLFSTRQVVRSNVA
jgi:hypothetical protein